MQTQLQKKCDASKRDGHAVCADDRWSGVVAFCSVAGSVGGEGEEEGEI